MRKKGLFRSVQLLLLAVTVAVCGNQGTVFALPTSSSSHYQLTETQFSAGSTQQSCSAQYCAQASLGDTSSGQVSSAAFGAVSNTQPLLAMIIETGESNLGVLTTEKTATKVMNVKVRNFLSGGYVLQIVGDTPKFNGHNLAPMSTRGGSEPGKEQFGLNLSANTNPTVGADVAQVPADQAIFGVANDDYKIPNQFKYVSGDVIAHGVLDSGEASYTISMIVNIANSTPAGRYAGDFSAVLIPLY